MRSFVNGPHLHPAPAPSGPLAGVRGAGSASPSERDRAFPGPMPVVVSQQGYEISPLSVTSRAFYIIRTSTGYISTLSTNLLPVGGEVLLKIS